MSIFLFVICLIPPLLIAALLFFRKSRNSKLITAVLSATLFHEVFLVTYPVLYSIVTDFYLEKSMNISVSTNDLTKVMFGESIYVLMFCLVLMFGLGRSKLWKKRDNDISHDSYTIPKAEYNLLGLLVILGAFLFGTQLIIFGAGITNAVVAQMYDWATGAFFSFTPLVASAILITKKQSFRKYPLLSIFALICLISLIILGLLLGLRGRIMWVASLIAIAGYLNSEKKYLFIATFGLVLFLPIFSLVGGNYRGFVAQTIHIEGGGPVEIIKMVIQERENITANDKNTSFLDSFAFRAQGPRNSVVLYNLYENGAGADPSVYTGSILFPVPRFFWPEKPIAGSLDDKDESTAVYKVIDIGHGLPYMGPLLASAHAYWEGGWIAVILYGFITGLLWLGIFVFCRKLPVHLAWMVALSFAAALLIDGFLTALYPLYAYILIAWKYVMPTLVLYGMLKILLLAGGEHRNARPNL